MADKKKKKETGIGSPFRLRRKKKKEQKDETVDTATALCGPDDGGDGSFKVNSKLKEVQSAPSRVVIKSKSTTYLGKIERPPNTTRSHQMFDLSPEQLHQLYPNARNGVPPLVNDCVELLQNHMDKEGIFRICGRKTDILELKIAVESGEKLPEDANPYAVAGLLSQFLQSLPEPLIPYDQYDKFIKVAAIPTFEQAKENLVKEIQRLPQPNRFLLEYLMRFLSQLAEHSERNRMDARNLSLVFGASLLNPPVGANFSVMNVQYQSQLVQMMIDNYDSVFAGIETAPKALPELNLGRFANIASVTAGDLSSLETVRMMKEGKGGAGAGAGPEREVEVRKPKSATSIVRAPVTSLDSPKTQRKRKGRWKKILDPQSGDHYYWHTKTGATTWEQPEGYVENPTAKTTVFDPSRSPASARRERASTTTPSSSSSAPSPSFTRRTDSPSPAPDSPETPHSPSQLPPPSPMPPPIASVPPAQPAPQ